MRSLSAWTLAGSLVLTVACKSPQEAAEQERVRKVEDGLTLGKAAMEARDWALAVKHFKDAAFVRTHYDAMEIRVPDAPRSGEIVLAIVVTDGGRPHPRIGGLTKDEAKKEDGLR